MFIDSANIIRQKRKTLKITIDNSGQINIFSPYNLSFSKIESLLQPKESLILKKANQIKKRAEENSEILNYNKILILGEEYSIVSTVKEKKPYFYDRNLLIPKKYFDANKLNFIIKKTLIELAKKIIKNRAEQISLDNPEYSIKEFVIGNFKSKWGSCDNLHIIKLNWKLVMLPKDIIDFVIYHEIAHTKELNHSKNFYIILEQFVQKHKQKRKILKDYNYLLTLY